ncbi:MAG: HAMP domain-containing histidine kinase [Desulfobacterales bacterium]|nr:HAMP domain-containing histidine kinase [Desulfobacterales bacterium]
MKINDFLKNSVFRTGLEEQSHLKPARLTLYITFSYAIAVSFYIWFSGKVALNLSNNIENLAVIELIKGLLFVLATSMVLFFGVYKTLRKIEKKDNIILSQNKSLISTERLVMAGIFSSSVCHDLNNIMSIVLGNVELLEMSKNIDSKDRKSVLQISDSSKKLINLVKRMMDAGKGYIPGKLNYENLSNVICKTIDFAKIHQKVKTCQIQCNIQPNISLHINSILIGRTLMNLILNAADATNKIGKILINLERDHRFVTIDVHDDGPGISEDTQEKIFEPFYTSKIDGNGLGLLSLKLCARQHDATIQVKKSKLGGACFSLSFPLESNKQKAQPGV